MKHPKLRRTGTVNSQMTALISDSLLYSVENKANWLYVTINIMAQ